MLEPLTSTWKDHLERGSCGLITAYMQSLYRWVDACEGVSTCQVISWRSVCCLQLSQSHNSQHKRDCSKVTRWSNICLPLPMSLSLTHINPWVSTLTKKKFTINPKVSLLFLLRITRNEDYTIWQHMYPEN